jgi:hypothetical protein
MLSSAPLKYPKNTLLLSQEACFITANPQSVSRRATVINTSIQEHGLTPRMAGIGRAAQGEERLLWPYQQERTASPQARLLCW